MVTRFSRWAMNKLSRTDLRKPDLELGGVYIFAYEPDRKEGELPPQDLMPVFIITHAYSNRLWGINMQGLPNKQVRIQMLDRYKEAMAQNTDTARMRALYQIRRIVQNNKTYAPAYVSYKPANIKTRVASCSIEDLEELIRRIL